ncbi:MAG: 4Fe-4S binding protein [Proteobacteria bacterium]|nr:4Fe-4S binding protein [Pseudomonadota bacterium]
MPLIESLFYSIKAARYNPLIIIHSLCYAATVTYLSVLKNLVKLNSASFRDHISQTYHSKVIRLHDASKFISINRNIEIRNLEQVLSYKHAKDIILKNSQNIVVYHCPCRGQKKDACQPTDVCLVVGEPFVDLVRMFQPFRSRRISPGEALKILKEEDERGHVHTAWFKTAMLDRFFAICNCCKCCCLGMKFMAEYNMRTVLPSGYRSVIKEACDGCGECATYCQFDAIQTVSFAHNGKEKRRCRVIPRKCFGCGICESKCKKGNISMILDAEKGIPLDIETLSQTTQNIV